MQFFCDGSLVQCSKLMHHASKNTMLHHTNSPYLVVAGVMYAWGAKKDNFHVRESSQLSSKTEAKTVFCIQGERMKYEVLHLKSIAQ